MLAINAGTMVSAEQLIDELWPEEIPASAKTTVQTYVYHLRKIHPNGKTILVTRPAGYILDVPRDLVDVFRFQSLMDQGRQALRHGDLTQAADLLRRALALWRGPMLADVACGPRLQGYATYFEELRLEALSLRTDADLATGRHQEIIGELRSLVQAHRLNECLHVRLMQALHRSGRRGEALDAYQQLRRLLGEELGLEPSADARQVQQQILAN